VATKISVDKTSPTVVGSVWLPVAAVVVFVIVFPLWFASTVATISKLADDKAVKLPKFQVPVEEV
jgi:hypothetical protein